MPERRITEPPKTEASRVFRGPAKNPGLGLAAFSLAGLIFCPPRALWGYGLRHPLLHMGVNVRDNTGRSVELGKVV